MSERLFLVMSSVLKQDWKRHILIFLLWIERLKNKINIEIDALDTTYMEDKLSFGSALLQDGVDHVVLLLF